MSVTIAEFWRHAVASRLLDQQQAEELVATFQDEATSAQRTTPKGLADWLIRRQAITRYQAKVLLAGRPGPFIYGDYRVESRSKQPPLADWFRAKHMPTEHPVLLRFLSPETVRNEQQWLAVQQRVNEQIEVQHPNLQDLFGLVSLPRYRFLVAQDPEPAVREVTPLAGPIPAQEACRIIRLAALALAQLHLQGQAHGELFPGCLFRTSQGNVLVLREWVRPLPCDLTTMRTAETAHLLDYLAPELSQAGLRPNPLTDIYALGCSLYELLTGEPPFPGGDSDSKQQRHAGTPIQSLLDRGIPKDVENVVNFMMGKNPSVRYQDAATVAEQLAACLEPDQLVVVDSPAVPTLARFVETLPRPQQTSYSPAVRKTPASRSAPEPSPKSELPSAGPQIVIVDDAIASQPVDSPVASTPSAIVVADAAEVAVEPARHARRQRRPSRSGRPALPPGVIAVAGIFAGLVLIIGVWWLWGTGGGDANGQAEVKQAPETTGVAGPPGESSGALSAGLIDGQQVVPDDGEQLWKSPTWGEPISFEYSPPGAQLFFVLRPSALLASAEGQRVLQALGPEFAAARKSWEQDAGVNWSEISQLIMTLHQEELRLRVAFVVKLDDSGQAQDLLQRWGGPEQQQAHDQTYYQSPKWCYYLPEETASVFVMGGKTEVEGVLEFSGRAPPNGAIEKLRRVSDADHHFSLFSTPFSMTGELLRDGREYFFGPARKLREPLDALFPQGLDALSVSMHFGEQFYLETRFFGRTRDRHALAADFHKRIAEIPDQIERYSARVLPHPYWRMVANRYPGMVRFLHRQLRIGVGRDEAVINGVLPAPAAHNLLFGGTMFLMSQPGVALVDNSATESAGPQNLELLLASKIDLSFDQQSLEFSIRDLGQEVKDRYPNLPFDFRIQIVGADLENDGITRNQQVRNINLNDKSLSESLTEIVVVAQATGKPPSHPDQKLIWVVGPDPEQPDKQIVLVTTRSAAMKNNYTLPAVFRGN